MAGPECTTDLWMTVTFEKPKTWQLKLSLVLSEAMLFAFTQVVKKNKKNKGAQQDSLSATQGNWKSLLVEDGNNLAVFLTLRTGLFFFLHGKHMQASILGKTQYNSALLLSTKKPPHASDFPPV